jgi:hypothetical protein
MRARHMIRPAVRALAAVGLVAGGWLAVEPAEAAPATSVDDVGWWSRTNQEPTLGGVLVAPDVPPEHVLVEGTPEGATAIAALRATLPDGTGNPVLTLQAASAVGGDSAVLLACQSGSGWTGVHAGAWDAKPSPDCSKSVQGIPSEDASSWSFALAPLQFADQIDIVLTPGTLAGAEGVGSAFRVVFERPEASDIEVSDAPTPAPDLPPVSMPGAGGFSTKPPSVGGGTVQPSFQAPSASSGDQVQVAAPPVRAALPAQEQGATATAPALQAAQPLVSPALAATGGSDGRLLGVVVVLGAGALLYWSSQQPLPERRLLSRFASSVPHAAVEASTSPTVGGLGRFRRQRTGAARRLAG